MSEINQILQTIKRLIKDNTEEELRDAHAIVFNAGMRWQVSGHTPRRVTHLIAIIQALIQLKEMEE